MQIAEFVTTSDATVTITEIKNQMNVRWENETEAWDYSCDNWEDVYLAVTDAEGKLNYETKHQIDDIYYSIRAAESVNDPELAEWFNEI
jgi:hypothetical protein